MGAGYAKPHIAILQSKLVNSHTVASYYMVLENN